MGYFGTKLKRVMEETDTTFRLLAERCGISRPTLNQITLGEIESPSKSNVEMIVGAFSRQDHICDLCLAHLEDEFPIQGRPLIRIAPIDPDALKEQSPPYSELKLSHEFEQAVVSIRREAASNPRLVKAVILLVKATCAP